MKVKVRIHKLVIGEKEWHKDEVMYHTGDIIDVPDMEAAKKLGTSVTIVPEPVVDVPVEVKDEVVESADEPVVDEMSETSVEEIHDKKPASRRRK